MDNQKKPLINVEASVIWTVLGIILLFSGAVIITLEAPRHIDPTWTEPASYYQVQMYEVADPRLYVSSTATRSGDLQFVHHIQKGKSLLAFIESASVRYKAPPELEKYITKYGEKTIKLTPEVLLLRKPQSYTSQGNQNGTDYQVFELYRPDSDSVFSVAETDGVYDDFVAGDFEIIGAEETHPYFSDPGVVYIKNPKEYRIIKTQTGGAFGWRYDPEGEPVASLEQLRAEPLGFRSRKELIETGEAIYAHEGCWYCHSDQTRTLVQDVVLNGTESFPAPPSSSNEYIFERITFPGTRRIGPDLSRVAIKRPSRDWHKGHFWEPRTESPGSIMPSFRHFFDDDPSGQVKSVVGIPNYRFEAIFQYLMTKGNRITPPTEAWWIGKDPVDTLEIIQGKKVLSE